MRTSNFSEKKWSPKTVVSYILELNLWKHRSQSSVEFFQWFWARWNAENMNFLKIYVLKFLAHFTTHIHNVRTDITAQRGFEWTFWMCFQISSKYISILCACPSRRWLRRLRSSDWQSRRQQPFLGLFSRFSTADYAVCSDDVWPKFAQFDPGAAYAQFLVA